MAILNPGDFPIDPSTTTGSDLADRLNRLVTALESQHSNGTRPPYLTAGGLWMQPQGAGGFKIFVFDGTRDCEIGSISATGVVTIGGGGGGGGLAPVFNAGITYAAGAIIHDAVTGNYLQARHVNGPGAFSAGDWQAVTNLIDLFILKAGGSMTGPLTLSGNATSNLHAVTKQQLDTGLAAKADTTHTHTAAQVTGVVKSVNGQAPDGAGNVTVTVSGGGGFTQGQADALYLHLSGGTVTGALTVNQAIHSNVSVTAPRLNITSNSGLAMPSVNELATYVGGRASFVAQIDGTCRVNANLTIGGDGLKPGGGPWSASSDKRIKRNVADYTIGLDDINDLRPVRYQYNGKFGSIESDQNYIGLIADEVLETRFADSVHEIEHVDPKTGVKTMVKSINGNAFTYALMNAVKELSARVIALETKLAAK